MSHFPQGVRDSFTRGIYPHKSRLVDRERSRAYFTGAGKGELLSEELTTLGDLPPRRLTFRSPTAFPPVIADIKPVLCEIQKR
jgi:hypothetical protein